MYRLIVVLLLGACTTASSMSLEQRFAEVAFHDDGAPSSVALWRWERPIRVAIFGSQEFNDLVEAQVAQLSELTNQPYEMNSDHPTITIEFSSRNRETYCRYSLRGRPAHYSAEIYIATDQHSHHIRRCIAQELSQAMGLLTDTDGRRDTAFSSAIGTDYLTDADLALFAILYDHRLHAGMPRDQVLAILPEIVADVEAAQALR